MNRKVSITSIFVFFKAAGLLVIALAPLFIPYLGFFPYKNQLDDFNLPHLISSFGNFDGIHYLLIAKNGYVQFEQAFFPLYPLLIKLLTPLFPSALSAALFISNILFLSGLFLIDRLFGDKKNYWLILFIFAYPAAFYYGAIYNEGLFFFLLVGTLYFLKRKNYPVTAVMAFFAALTRLIGVFTVIPIFIHWWFTDRSKRALAVIAAPVLGLSTYCFYLYQTTGDPLYFLSSQPAFGANRSTHLILLPQVVWRYLKIFTTAAMDFRYFISAVEFVLFMLVFSVLVLDLLKHVKIRSLSLKVTNHERLGLNLFSMANIILPTLTGTLSSIPRYSLMSLSFFLYLTEIGNKWVKMVLALIFVVFHIVLLAFFAQGYFIS